MSQIVRKVALSSVGVIVSILMVGPAQAAGIERGSAAGDRTISIVASFLESESTELTPLEGSFAMSAPSLSIPETLVTDMTAAGLALSTALMLSAPAWDATNELLPAIPPTQVAADSATPKKFESVIGRMKPRSGSDPLELSRSAFPMVVGPVRADVGSMRPMVGPVVGVRPAYIRAASFR